MLIDPELIKCSKFISSDIQSSKTAAIAQVIHEISIVDKIQSLVEKSNANDLKNFQLRLVMDYEERDGEEVAA